MFYTLFNGIKEVDGNFVFTLNLKLDQRINIIKKKN